MRLTRSDLGRVSRRLDLFEAEPHRAEYEPDADGCARRVAFLGWSFLLLPMRNGHGLFLEEEMRSRPHAAPFAVIALDGAISLPDGRVLGDRGDLRTTIRRPGDLPFKDTKRWPVPCACCGCAPVAVDDGRRPRGTILQTQESTANVGTPLRRKLQVESRVPPADADAPECTGCGKVVPIAVDMLCWTCLANGYLNGGGA